MMDDTDNQKKVENAENRTALCSIRYTKASIRRISLLSSRLEVVIDSKSPVIKIFFRQRQTTTATMTDKTDCLTPLVHTRRRVITLNKIIMLYTSLIYRSGWNKCKHHGQQRLVCQLYANNIYTDNITMSCIREDLMADDTKFVTCMNSYDVTE